MQIDVPGYPYRSQRMPVLAERGVVATSQPLAAQAGLSILQQGGNAVDAAIATGLVLTVVEPTSNGIGSDVFALVWDGDKLHGLNGSGRAPARATAAACRAEGNRTMPVHGWWPITVPGAPRAWFDLHQRFGKLPFEKLFEPAIYYAEQGYLVSPVIAHYWRIAAERTFGGFDGPEFRPWFETFAPDGKVPSVGDRWSSPALAATLRTIAASGGRDFYEGDLAAKIAGFAAETGGLIDRDDLAAHTSSWVEPIGVSYRGHEVWEIPPNGQGIAALIGLNILEGLDLAQYARESVESYHLQIEALKLGLIDAGRYVADQDQVQVPVDWLLSAEYAAERRALIGDRALDPLPGKPPTAGTIYLCAADSDGMMVSYIQSNYVGFGSGLVVPNTGIALHNRGFGFTLEQGHPNELAPRKRPFHTIIPGFLTRESRAIGPFGVMGGFMQAQGHLQMIVNQLDYGHNPQVSLDAPRWRWSHGRRVYLEADVDPRIVAGLRARGHDAQIEPVNSQYGRGQIIRRLPAGGYMAGSDWRSDGYAVGY